MIFVNELFIKCDLKYNSNPILIYKNNVTIRFPWAGCPPSQTQTYLALPNALPSPSWPTQSPSCRPIWWALKSRHTNFSLSYLNRLFWCLCCRTTACRPWGRPVEFAWTAWFGRGRRFGRSAFWSTARGSCFRSRTRRPRQGTWTGVRRNPAFYGFGGNWARCNWPRNPLRLALLSCLSLLSGRGFIPSPAKNTPKAPILIKK